MAELTVNSGEKLQDVINSANPGDTIIVPAGDYSSEGTITINKSITIKAAKPAATAADADKSIIDNIRINDGALTVEIDGLQINSKTKNDMDSAHGIYLGTLFTESVTVKNCNIDITGGTKGSNGIKMTLNVGDTTENIIIEDNIITGSAENTESLIHIGNKDSLKSLSVTGNILSGCSSHGMNFDFTAPKDYDIIIDNNNVSDCGRDGIKLAGLKDAESTVTIEENVITNVNNARCDADDGAIAIRGERLEKVTIANNTVSNAQVGVYFDSAVVDETANITVSDNSIAIVEKHAPGVGETPAASGISGYDIPAENTTNTIQTLEKFTSIVVDNSLTDAAGEVVIVDGKNYIMGKNAFASINAAVEAAADGATITLTAGAYEEYVHLETALLNEKSLTFQGETDADGKSLVIMKGGLEIGDFGFNRNITKDLKFCNIKFEANPGEDNNYNATAEDDRKKVQINNAGKVDSGSITFDKCSFYAVDKDSIDGEYIDEAYILVQQRNAHGNGYFCNVKYNECDFSNGRISFYMGNGGNEFIGCTFNDAPINDQTGNYKYKDCVFNADLSKIADGNDHYVVRINRDSSNSDIFDGAVFNVSNSGNVDFNETANIIWIRSNESITTEAVLKNVTINGLEAENMAGINPFGNTVYNGDKTASWNGEEEKIFVKGLLVDGFESEDDIKALLARTSGVLHAVVGNKYYIYNDGVFASATDISTIFVDSAFAEEGVPEGKVFGVNAFTDINAANDMAVNADNAKIVIAENAVYTTGVFDNIADNSDAYWGPVSPANNVTTVQIDGSVEASTAAVINNKKATVSSTGSLKGVEHVTVTGENGELLVAGEVTTNNLRTVLGASITVSGKAFLNGVTVGDTYWGTSDKKSVITFDGAEVEYSGQGGGDSDPLQFNVIDGNELNIINKSTVKSSAARYKLTINVGKDADFNVESGSSVTAENITNNGKVKVDGATLNLAGTVTNNKEMFISGASVIKGSFTGDGWVYVKNATLDANTNIQGANVRFVEGNSVIDGAAINLANDKSGYFQVGAGHKINDPATDKDGEVDRVNGVTVTVQNGAKIGGNVAGYGGWVGTEYYSDNAAKVENMTDARYTLNIENSTAAFNALHVSNDGILNVSGRSDVKHRNATFYTGTVANYNGKVTFDNVDAFAAGNVNVSGDNTSVGDAAGSLSIKNKSSYKIQKEGDNSVALNIKNYGKATIDDSELLIRGSINVAENASLDVINGATVDWTDADVAITLNNNGTVTLVGGTLNVENIINNKILKLDDESVITADSLSGSGKITIDAAGFSGVRKVVDVEDGGMGISDITVENNSAARFVQNEEGDIILVNVDGSNVVVNAAWTSQADVDAALNNPSEITGVYFGSNGNAFNNLADAAAAVSENGTIALMQGQDENGKDLSISAAAQVVKDMTITGNAKFDWSKGQLYVGRGTGAKDATLTIKDAVILSASNQAATGFHISNAEIGATDTKANGTLIIRNSQVEVDYMINKNKVEVIGDEDHTKYDLFVKNGFDVAGRKASETVDGNVHEAVLEIDGGYVRIDNENGMGLGRAGEGAGKLYIYNNGKFEALQDFHVDTEEGKIVVEDSTLIVKGKLSEYSGAAAGKVTVSSSEGKSSTLQIGEMVGTIVAVGDTTLKDSTIGATGKVEVTPAYQYALSVNGKDTGTLTFEGENKIASIDAGKGDKVIVGKDATLEITLDDGMKIGNGAEWNITGNLAEGAAKSEETAAAIANSEITASLKSGWYFLSLDGSDADSVTTMTVSNAYVKGGHFSGKSKNVNDEYFDGTFNVTYTNSYIEQDGRFELQRKSSDDAAKDTDPQVNITYKDSVVAGNLQYYVNYQENATVTFDNSTASYTTRFQNEGSLKVLNGAEVSFVNGTVAVDGNSQPAGHNTGLIEVNGGELTFTDKALVNTGTINVIDGTFIGSVENSGTFTVSSTEGKSSTLDMELTAGTVTVAGGTSLSNTEIVGNGTTELSGTVNFYGDNVITTTGINTNKLIVNKGASLEITRFVLAYGRSVSVYGNIADATALDETTIKNEKVSFKTAGISINGGGTGDFYAENAYIDLTGGDTTIKSESTATGKYTYTFKNSYLRTKNFGNNRSTAGSWTVTFDDSNVYGTSDLGIGNNVEVKFTNGSVGYFDRCIEMRGGTLTVDATSKLTVNGIMNNKKGELNTENEDIYGTVNVYGELALNDGNNNQGIDFIDAEVNVKGGKFTSDAQLIVVGDSQFNIDSLGFIDVKSMTGDNISISVDAAGFTETKKLIDVDEASFDNATIKVINKAADSKADTLVFNNDLYITDQDKSTLYVNSDYADDEVGDIVDGKIIGYNAFGSIADVIENSADADTINIQLGGTTLAPASKVTYITGDSSKNPVGNIDNKTVTISGVNNTDEYLWFDLNNNVEESTGKTTTSLTFDNAQLYMTKLKAYNDATVAITNSTLDFMGEKNNNIYTKGSGQIKIKDSSILKLGILSAHGDLLELDNSTLEAGSVVRVQTDSALSKGKMIVGNNSVFSLSSAKVYDGGTLTITDSTMIRKAFRTDNDKSNADIYFVNGQANIPTALPGYAYCVFVGASQYSTTAHPGTGTMTVTDSVFDFSKAYADAEYSAVSGYENSAGLVGVGVGSSLTVTNSTFNVDRLINEGEFEVGGASKMVVDSFTGNMDIAEVGAVFSNDSKIIFAGDNDTVYVNGDVTFQAGDLTGVENWEGAGKININDVTLPGEVGSVDLLSDSDNDVEASQLVINGSNVVNNQIVSNGKVYDVVNEDGKWTIKQYVAPTPGPGDDPVEPAYTPMTLIAGVKQSDEADESGNYTFTISAEADGGKLLDGEKYEFTYSAYYEADGEKKTINVADDGTFNAPFSVGNVVVSVTVKDAFGDSTAVSSNIGYVVKDYVAPELNLDLNGYTSGSWSTESVTLTASASDVDNNAAKVMFSTDNGDNWAEFNDSVTLSDDEYDYWFKAVDGAGNESAIEKVSVKVDSSDPTMEISGNVAEWTNGNVTLFANVADSTSGIASVKYQIGDGEWTDYTDAGVLVEENADVKFEVIDNAGNKTENSVLVDKIDKVAPTLEISGNAEKWTNQPVELTAAYSDGTVEYFNGSEWVAGDKLTVTENGTYLFRVTDAAGNVAEQSVVVDKIDTTKADLTVVGNATEWTNGNVTLFAKVADSASGIASVKYQIGDGDWTDYTNAGVTVEENADVKFEVIDNAGNVTEWTEKVGKIDKDAAVLTITGNAADWTNGDVTLFAGANEEDAVIEYLKNGEWVAYTNDGVTVEENSIVSFKVTDKAGNVTYKSEEVKFIDKVAPTMELTASTVEATNADVVLNAVVSDGTVEYFNGTEWVVGSEYTVSENGTYQFRVTDAAGNVTVKEVVVDNIDKDAPTMELTASTVDATNSDVELTATVSDGTVEYFNGSEWVVGSEYTVSENGTYQFRVTDAAGNVTESSIEVTNIDKVAPTLTLAASTVDATNSDVELTATVSDGTVEYYNGSNWVAGDKLTVSANGTYQFRVTDAAGNVTESSIEVANIDKVAPEFSIAYNDYLTESPVTLSVIDVVDDSEYKVEYFNGSEWVVGSEYTVSENGTYKFRVTDAAGNEKVKEVVVDNIWSADAEIKPEVTPDFESVVVDGKMLHIDESHSEYANSEVQMAAGTTTVNVANGKKDNKSGAIEVTALEIGSISKVDDADGVNNLTAGKYTDVKVNGNIEALGKLSVGNEAEIKVAGTVIGTDANQTVKIGNDSKAVFGDIDLKGGTNNISIGARSEFEAGTVAGLSKLTVANGKPGADAEFVADALVGTAKNNTLTFGNYNDTTVDVKIDLGDGKDTVNFGKNSSSSVGAIANVETIKIGANSGFYADSVTGLNKLTVANGKQVGDGQVYIAEISGTEKNDTLTFGNYNDTSVDVKIDLGDGKDTVNFGKNSSSRVGAIANVETIKIGANSGFRADSVTGLNKLTVANGKQGEEGWGYIAEISGTEKNDTITLGNWNVAWIGSVDFGDGKDTLNLGSNGELYATSLDFGDGKDTLSIGKNSTLSVEEIKNLETLNASKGSVIEFSNGADDVEFDSAMKGSWKNATIMDEAGDLVLGENSVNVYSNEYDVFSFTADQNGRLTLDGDDAVTFEYQMAGSDKWLVYNDSIDLAAGDELNIRVAVDFEDKKDKFAKTIASFTAELA